MKTSTPPSTTSRSKQTAEREAFFERCYLSLLSGCLHQFEWRDEYANPHTLYAHPALEAESEQEEERFAKRKSGKHPDYDDPEHEQRQHEIEGRIHQADEKVRIEVLVDRSYRLALEATSRYFEARDFASKF